MLNVFLMVVSYIIMILYKQIFVREALLHFTLFKHSIFHYITLGYFKT